MKNTFLNTCLFFSFSAFSISSQPVTRNAVAHKAVALTGINSRQRLSGNNSRLSMLSGFRQKVRLSLLAILAVLTVQSSHLLAAEVIDINQASVTALAEGISGIGPVKAQAIVDYRNANGEFSTLSDLLSVPGIGQSLFERIKLGLSIEQGQPATGSTDQPSAQVSSSITPVITEALPAN